MRRFSMVVAVMWCGCSTTLDVTNYERSCTQKSDCVAVHPGDQCAACGCPSTAINVKDQSRFEADVQRLRMWCGPTPPIACVCAQLDVECVSGTCQGAPSH